MHQIDNSFFIQILWITPIIAGGLLIIRNNLILENVRKFIDIFDILETLFTLGITSYLLWQVFKHNLVFNQNILNLSGGDLVYLSLGSLLDKLSVGLLQLVAILLLLIKCWNLDSIFTVNFPSRYYIYLNLLKFSIIILLFANNLVQLLVGFIWVGQSYYLLCDPVNKAKPGSIVSFKSLFFHKIADWLLLLAISLTYYYTSNLQEFATTAACGSNVAIWMMLAGYCKSMWIILDLYWLEMKSYQIVFPRLKLLVSLIAMLAGIFLLFRFKLYWQNDLSASNILLAIGMISMLMAGFLASVAVKIKKIILYHLLAQLSLVFIVIASAGYNVAVWSFINFMAINVLLLIALEDSEVANLAKNTNNPYINYLAITLVVLNLINFPLTSNFFTNNLIVDWMLNSHLPLAKQGFWFLLINNFLCGFYGAKIFINLVINSNSLVVIREWSKVLPKTMNSIVLVILVFGLLVLGFCFPAFYENNLLIAKPELLLSNDTPQSTAWQYMLLNILLSSLKIHNFGSYIGVAVAIVLYLKSNINRYLLNRLQTNFLFLVKLIKKEYFWSDLINFIGFLYEKIRWLLEETLETKLINSFFPKFTKQFILSAFVMVERLHKLKFIDYMIISLASMGLMLLWAIAKF